MADCFCSTSDSTGTAERLETYSGNDTAILRSCNGIMSNEEFYSCTEFNGWLNTQSTINPVRPLNCERCEGFEDDPDNAQRYRLEDEIADSFEDDVVLSAADRFRCFIHVVYDIIIALSYRIPKTVKKIRVYPDNCFFGVCPRCNNSIDREYQTFCNCCGQRLDWSKLDEAEEQWINRNK